MTQTKKLLCIFSRPKDFHQKVKEQIVNCCCIQCKHINLDQSLSSRLQQTRLHLWASSHCCCSSQLRRDCKGMKSLTVMMMRERSTRSAHYHHSEGSLFFNVLSTNRWTDSQKNMNCWTGTVRLNLKLQKNMRLLHPHCDSEGKHWIRNNCQDAERFGHVLFSVSPC